MYYSKVCGWYDFMLTKTKFIWSKYKKKVILLNNISI